MHKGPFASVLTATFELLKFAKAFDADVVNGCLPTSMYEQDISGEEDHKDKFANILAMNNALGGEHLVS